MILPSAKVSGTTARRSLMWSLAKVKERRNFSINMGFHFSIIGTKICETAPLEIIREGVNTVDLEKAAMRMFGPGRAGQADAQVNYAFLELLFQPGSDIITIYPLYFSEIININAKSQVGHF